MQAGVITNTLPGGGTGGANGNTHYMAIQRSGGPGSAGAIFSSPAGTSGSLSVQWDMYDVGPGANWQIYLSDSSQNPFGNVGPFVQATYYGVSSTDMEIATRTTPSYTFNDLGGLPTNAWVHMDLEVNLAAQNYQFLANGNSLGTWGYINPGTVGPLNSLFFYGANNAGETLYLDNVNVNYTPVPEPVTLSLLSLSSLFVLRRAGRVRKC
jgi:hypothetical protein